MLISIHPTPTPTVAPIKIPHQASPPVICDFLLKLSACQSQPMSSSSQLFPAYLPIYIYPLGTYHIFHCRVHARYGASLGPSVLINTLPMSGGPSCFITFLGLLQRDYLLPCVTCHSPSGASDQVFFVLPYLLAWSVMVIAIELRRSAVDEALELTEIATGPPSLTNSRTTLPSSPCLLKSFYTQATIQYGTCTGRNGNIRHIRA